MVDLEVRDEREQHRYVGSLDGRDAGYVEYVELGDGVLDLQHTVVEDAYAGQGVGSALVRTVLEDIRARRLRIVPTCPFVAAYLRRHPDDADLVAA